MRPGCRISSACHPRRNVARAIECGRDRAALASYRERLIAGRGTAVLFDTPGLVRGLEALFRGMWDDFAAGRLPRPNLVNLDTYLEFGAAMEHDAVETSFDPEHDARWQSAVARRHAYAALPPDARLHWGR